MKNVMQNKEVNGSLLQVMSEDVTKKYKRKNYDIKMTINRNKDWGKRYFGRK